jgi:hypothetical protein
VSLFYLSKQLQMLGPIKIVACLDCIETATDVVVAQPVPITFDLHALSIYLPKSMATER